MSNFLSEDYIPRYTPKHVYPYKSRERNMEELSGEEEIKS